MEKPKIIIVGISNDKEACRSAIEHAEKIGFETLVIDPRTVIDKPETTMEKLKSAGQIYDAKLIYPKPKSKYHN